MLDMFFSRYIGNKVDGVIAIVKYWCLVVVLMLENKYGLGVGGIDRL